MVQNSACSGLACVVGAAGNQYSSVKGQVAAGMGQRGWGHSVTPGSCPPVSDTSADYDQV